MGKINKKNLKEVVKWYKSENGKKEAGEVFYNKLCGKQCKECEDYWKDNDPKGVQRMDLPIITEPIKVPIDVLIVAQTPGKPEVSGDKEFQCDVVFGWEKSKQNKDEKKYKGFIKKVFNGSTVYVTDAVKCYTERLDDAFDNCKKHLISEIKSLKPETIIFMTASIKAIKNKEKIEEFLKKEGIDIEPIVMPHLSSQNTGKFKTVINFLKALEVINKKNYGESIKTLNSVYKVFQTNSGDEE